MHVLHMLPTYILIQNNRGTELHPCLWFCILVDNWAVARSVLSNTDASYFFRTTMSRTAMTKEMDHMEMIWVSLTCSVVCLWYVHLLCVWLLALGSWACFIFNLDLYLWVECWTSRLSRCLLSVSWPSVGPLPVCGCLACLWTVMYGCDLCAMWLLPHCLWTVMYCVWLLHSVLLSSVYASMHGCNYCVELTVLSGYMYIDVPIFVLSIPDRNRHVPGWSIPSLISRNIEFVFPSGFPVPGHIMLEREWLRCFPDRSRPFSTLCGHGLEWWSTVFSGGMDPFLF